MSFRRLFPYLRALGIVDLIDLAIGDSNEVQQKHVKRKKHTQSPENLLGLRTIIPSEAQFRRDTLHLEDFQRLHYIETSTVTVGIIYNIPNEPPFPSAILRSRFKAGSSSQF